MAEKKLTALLDIIKYSANLLQENGIKDARLNVELMFCEILDCDRMKLYLDFDKPLSQDEISAFKLMLKRRIHKEPLQYVLGKTNFYGYDIKLNNKVLIPRQETEILVDIILKDICSTPKEFVNILEIGSGSGCIAIALSKELTKKNIKHKILSVDISEDAVTLSKKNAELNGIISDNIEFMVYDFLQNNSLPDFDYIISNPPYIPKNDFNLLDVEVKLFEPENALTDGSDGLIFYRKIFNLFYGKAKIFLEIGDNRREYIEDELRKNNIKDYNFYKDYCNIDRVLTIN